jgi:hypothetical protein
MYWANTIWQQMHCHNLWDAIKEKTTIEIFK